MRSLEPDLALLFGQLVEARQRQRWRRLAGMGRSTLEDWPRFEPRYERLIHVRSIDGTLGELRTLGALKSCVAIALQGADFAVEGSLIELVTAVCLDELEWDGDRAENTIVICNPGRLAFFKDDYGTYGVVHKP
jgi:hypothetical protein